MTIKKKSFLFKQQTIKNPPTPENIKKSREQAGLNQSEMATVLGLTDSSYISKYERYGTDGKPLKTPNPQTWTLWLLLVGQHPDFEPLIRCED